MHNSKHRVNGQPARRSLMSISYAGNTLLPTAAGFFIGDDASAR